MVASLSKPADIVNAALVRIGWKQQIGNLYDGSAAANLGLAIYGQARDDLMRDGNWGFCQRTLSLTLLKAAPIGGYVPPTSWSPIYPQLPWNFEYEYPDDCLKMRAVKPVPIFVPNFDPTPYPFNIANDNTYSPAKRVILSNVQYAAGVYAARVVDPSTFPVDFSQALVDAVAEAIAPGLVGLQAAQKEEQEGAVTKHVAEMEQG